MDGKTLPACHVVGCCLLFQQNVYKFCVVIYMYTHGTCASITLLLSCTYFISVSHGRHDVAFASIVTLKFSRPVQVYDHKNQSTESPESSQMRVAD